MVGAEAALSSSADHSPAPRPAPLQGRWPISACHLACAGHVSWAGMWQGSGVPQLPGEIPSIARLGRTCVQMQLLCFMHLAPNFSWKVRLLYTFSKLDT